MIAGVTDMPAGRDRHAALVRALLALGRLVQGVADVGSAAAEWMAPLTELARAVLRSWDSGFATVGELPTLPDMPLPASLAVRDPEGFAYYTVYPEAYALAARRIGPGKPIRVIGIRSIGTTLSAMVAAALDAPDPVTVRPEGHPFDRQVTLDPVERGVRYVVVDEGPGLSGSSFAAVGRALMEQGVAPADILFMQSHHGAPGGQASAEVRAIWSAVARVPADGRVVTAQTVAAWIAGLTGPVTRIEDISGGGWRSHVFADEGDWPAVDPCRSPVAFLADAGDARWRAKFAGIGDLGADKLDRATHLAGLIPPVAGLAHGFLVERWIAARACAATDPDLLAAVARYLDARATLPPPERRGASLAALFEMAATNIGEALGERAAMRFRTLHRAGPGLRSRPMAVDGRMDLSKWVRTPDGAILKTDALDHDRGHDLVGPQDAAWDVAGAIAEIGAPMAALAERVDAGLLAFLHPCYLAFRMGVAAMAAASLEHWPQEAARNRMAAARYADAIRVVLGLSDGGEAE